MSSKDMEDIVFVAAECAGLANDVLAAGIRDDIESLWKAALAKHNLSLADLPDIVDCHLGRDERSRINEVIARTQALASPERP